MQVMQSHTQMSPAQKYEPDSPCFFELLKSSRNRLRARPALGRVARCFVIDKAGGANRDRTGDLLLAKQALSQLSYGPRKAFARGLSWWVWVDLNHRPHAYQACALTN